MRTALVCLLAALAVFAQPQPQPYKADQTYVYRFDTQVSSALLGASPQEIQQQAATRLRADVHITFTSDRHARLQFQQVQIGELNAELPKSQRVQPFERFQRRELQAHLKEQLHMPISFTYVDGAVEAIKFGEKDMAWSKNLKRAALNLLQVNLKRNNVQGLKMETMQEPLDKNTAVFSIPEITVEGECEVTYTVQKPLYKHDEEERREFNVTKSVNFNRCERTADITYGYSQKPAQELRCLNCIRQQQPQADADKIEQIKSAQCQKECRPNAINDQQDVDRSTVARYQLVGKQEKFAVRRASVLSQYLIKGQNPATQNTISQVIAITELVFREQIQGKQVPTFKHSQKEETLMYSPEWDVKEKQFYMYGDEEFEKNSPFAEAQKKDQQAMRSMRSILQAWNNKEQGYELDSALQFNDLVTVLRQCTVKEIEKIEQELRKEAREIGDKSEKQCIEIFEDALSVAATRNTLYVLAKKITQKEMTPIKAAQCLKVFIANQHSPSERQADLLQKICKSEIVQQSPTLKQTAWLTFGAAVGEICQDKPSETRKDYFRTEEMCPRGKKEQYKKVLIEELEKAVSTYHKMVAMKAIGNAALDIVIPELEKIINNKQEATLIRIEAIDALRRLRTNMPQKIQQILLPIFQNQHEQPEIRMTAFTMILYTHPEKSILDQLVFSTLNERSQNVKSFVLTCMNVLAQSPNQAEQEASQHMKAALKAVQIDNEQLKGSRGYRVPIYVSGTENQDEQNLFLGLGAIVSPTNMLPIALGASIRSAFNGQATEENLKVSFHQKNLEQWIGKIADFMNKYASSEELDENATRQSAKELRAIYSSLGLKSRRTGSYYIEGKEADEQMDQASEQPFGMIVVRINEVDKFLIPLEEHSLPQMVKRILKGEKPSLAGLNEWAHLAEGKHFYKHAAATLAEKKTKIPTSSGLPLAIISQFSSIGSIEGQLKLKMNEKKAELKLRTSGIATHLLKTELWTPVLVTGVESVRTVEWSGPIEAQAEMKNGELKLTIRPPQHKQRIFGLHTLPLTYTRQFDDQTKTYREQRVRSVHNYALEHTQYDFHQKHQANKCIRVEGHVHYPKSLEQFLQAMYTTENNMHVYFHPTETSPKELIIRAAGQSFERVDKYSRPEFETFYQQGFDSEEYDDMSLEKDEQRRSKLTKFVKSYAPKNSYKHNLMVSAEARCAAKTHKVQAEIMGECDSAMKHCKVQLNAERTPMGQESQQWKLQAKLQTITPELIRDDSQLAEKQNRILVQLDSKWGSETEQKMNIRLQAEPTKKQSTWMPAYGSSEESQEQQQQKPLGWSRFLNKIDLVAEYRLQPHQKHQLKRLFEVAKAYYFWQVQSQPQQGEQDVVRATMILDPINRQYANVSIKTPTERVRVESLRLPVNMPAYKLDRRPHSVHGMRHVIQRFAPWTSNAECRVTPQRVNTFDGVTYKAPLSSCWTVLAKDCSSAESHFSVLMKKTSQENKLKIITREQIIELEKCQDEQEGLCVKINGKIVKDQQELQQEGIHLEQEMVYVNVREIQVRFDGVECHLKLSALYKNTQCGLCGHYSDEEEDVFRMGNNRRTDSIKSFHRSYALKNEECTDQEFAKVYEQESREFRLDSSEESQELKEQRRRWNRNDEMSQESNEWSREQQLESRQQESASYEQNQKVQPVERTLEREHHHKICFSVEPVKRCPRGTVVDEEEQKPKEKKVKFACLNRSSVEARRILRQVRQGRVADLSAFSSSFVESVQQPQQCVVY